MSTQHAINCLATCPLHWLVVIIDWRTVITWDKLLDKYRSRHEIDHNISTSQWMRNNANVFTWIRDLTVGQWLCWLHGWTAWQAIPWLVQTGQLLAVSPRCGVWKRRLRKYDTFLNPGSNACPDTCTWLAGYGDEISDLVFRRILPVLLAYLFCQVGGLLTILPNISKSLTS